MKDIVILVHFCRDFSETDNGRFMYLAKALSKDNHVEIITTDFSHEKKQHKEPLVHTWPFQITFLHEPGYKKNISLKRFSSHHAWGKEVKRYLEQRKKPDIIYAAVPSLTGPAATAKYCEMNGVRFVIDIQDLWPEAFQMVFNVPIISGIVFSPFRYYVNGIYRRADAVCAVSQQYVDRALSVNDKCKKGHAVFLGTSLATFDDYAQKAELKMKKESDDELWLGYCGSLAASYDIPCVISALRILKEKGCKVPKFIIMGEGARKTEFEAKAQEAAVDAAFLGSLPYDQMCAQLMQCDIVVNPIVKGSAASIINKHGDYASSGRPVINTQDSQEYKALIEKYEMGLNCRNGDAQDVAEKLERLVKNRELRIRMGQNARRCAKEKFDRKYSYRVLIETILL